MATARVRRLDANHDMTFGRGQRNYASGAEAAAQRLRCRLLTIQGEWFLNAEAHVPWFELADAVDPPIMGGSASLQYAEAALKKVILETNGVASLTAFNMSFDHTTRKLTVTATGTTVDGDVWNIKVTSP